MGIDEIIILLIILIGIYFMLIPILRDPIYMFKSVVRGMKSTDNLRFTILFFPIWGPIWVIDKLMGSKIFIRDFEDASLAREIDFSTYEKYVIINSTDLNYIKRLISGFQNEYDPVEYNSDLSRSEIHIAQANKKIILRFEKLLTLDTFKLLIQFLDNSSPQDTIYNVKGVLINKIDKENSFFLFFDSQYLLKLIGKTYTHKKIYVFLVDSKNSTDKFYFNSNIDFIRNFNFEGFIEETKGLIFNKLNINPGNKIIREF